jgi:hypothetical protein
MSSNKFGPRGEHAPNVTVAAANRSARLKRSPAVLSMCCDGQLTLATSDGVRSRSRILSTWKRRANASGVPVRAADHLSHAELIQLSTGESRRALAEIR